MQEIIRKMITEAMAAQHADVNQVKKKRGQNFVIDDTMAYVGIFPIYIIGPVIGAVCAAVFYDRITAE